MESKGSVLSRAHALIFYPTKVNSIQASFYWFSKCYVFSVLSSSPAPLLDRPLSPTPAPPTVLPGLMPTALSVPDRLPFSLAQCWPSAPTWASTPPSSRPGAALSPWLCGVLRCGREVGEASFFPQPAPSVSDRCSPRPRLTPPDPA